MKILLALVIVAIAYGLYSNYGTEKAMAEGEVKTEKFEITKQQSTFLDTQLQAIEKSKKVEKILQDASDQRRVEIDGQ